MRQYLLPENYDGSGSIEVTGEESTYLTRVLRKSPGDRFPGLDPRGNRVSILLKSSIPGRCTLEITAVAVRTDSAPGNMVPAEITLFQSIPKAQKMDTIVRQAVEAGVTRVVPVQSENSLSRLDKEAGGKKRERWFRIARQAMQQSGRRRTLEIEAAVTVSEIPHMWSTFSAHSGIGLVFHEKRLSETSLHRLLSPAVGAVAICIGPEGGFSPEEVADLLDSGFQPVYINTNILRTETAALYAVAAVQTVILEKESWTVR